jgi:sugar O-acyltransferase (sialic acid O-acetyltransferase NeuD family)
VKRLAIYGASGHGKVVADIAELTGWQSIEFFDQAAEDIQKNGIWPVRGTFDDLLRLGADFDAAIVAIGNNQIRTDRAELLLEAGIELATLIHPSAIISDHSAIGRGTVIMANAVVNPFAAIGDHVILNTGAVIDHDCAIEDGAHICPGVNLAGEVRVGHKAWVGIGASVIQQRHIGENSIVGAGSVVIEDVPANVTVCGVPAKPTKSL